MWFGLEIDVVGLPPLDRFTWVFMLKSLRVTEAHECTASARVDKYLPVQMFDLVNLISSFIYMTAPKHGVYTMVVCN